MEIQAVLQLMWKKWWVILLTVGVIVVSTMFFTLRTPRVYSATVTYIISPSPELLDGSSFVNGLSVLGGQSTITNTYASIATSARIREKAVKALEINQEQNIGLVVSSRVRSGTNMIDISVEGTNPQLVQALANEIGRSTVTFVNQLYEVYDMNILDGAVLPVEPVSPNLILNLAVAGMLSLALGTGLAFVLVQVELPTIRSTSKESTSQEKDYSSQQDFMENF